MRPHMTVCVFARSRLPVNANGGSVSTGGGIQESVGLFATGRKLLAEDGGDLIEVRYGMYNKEGGNERWVGGDWVVIGWW